MATIERLIGGSSFFAIDSGRVTGPAEAALGFADIAVLCHTDAQTHAIAEALARGEARHPGAQKNQAAIESVRETYRRSGGKTPRLSLAELTALYEGQLADVNAMSDFRHARVYVNPDDFVPAAERCFQATKAKARRLEQSSMKPTAVRARKLSETRS